MRLHGPLQATRATAKLASTMPNLRAFVYVSTAYVNAHLPRGSHVEERIYPLHHSDGSRVQHAALAAALLALPPGRAARQARRSIKRIGCMRVECCMAAHACQVLHTSVVATQSIL